jgi:hypothetical protein
MHAEDSAPLGPGPGQREVIVDDISAAIAALASRWSTTLGRVTRVSTIESTVIYSLIRQRGPRGTVRGHEKVPAGGQVEVLAGGQVRSSLVAM